MRLLTIRSGTNTDEQSHKESCKPGKTIHRFYSDSFRYIGRARMIFCGLLTTCIYLC